MSTKTFRAATMLEALEKVQQELGPDALVISARNVPGGAAWQIWRQPEVEIVARIPVRALDPHPPAPSAAGAGERERAAKDPQPSAPSSTKEEGEKAAAGKAPAFSTVGTSQPARWQPVQMVRKEASGPDSNSSSPPLFPPFSRQREKGLGDEGLKRQREKGPGDEGLTPLASPLPESLRPLQHMLLAQDLEPAWVERVLKLAAGTLPVGLARDGETCRAFLRKQMEAELRAAPPDLSIPPQRVICLAGASGSGKTSLAARLAQQYSRNPRVQLHWACADTIRASAIAEARAYTQALNIPLSLVYTPGDWPAILEGPANLILVDTPGINPWNERHITELGELLPPVASRLLYLVVSATTRLKDTFQSAATLNIFGLHGLAVTRLEETRSYGPIFDLARKSRLPLAIFTSSRTISSGLELARSSRLVDAVLGKEWVS